MRTRFLTMLCVSIVAGALAMPPLQPDVKEYNTLGEETFSIKDLPVFYQNQRQCEIAADETTAAGEKSVWDGKDASRPGIYIAIEGSDCGERLVKEFALDVPMMKQGYALKAKGGRVAIVGRDPVGALYGAVTFAQTAALAPRWAVVPKTSSQSDRAASSPRRNGRVERSARPQIFFCHKEESIVKAGKGKAKL